MTGESGVTPLRLPLPTGMPPIEMVQPRNAGDTPQVQSVKFAWKATWHMTVDMDLLAIPGTTRAHLGDHHHSCCAPHADRARMPGHFPVRLWNPNAFQEGRENIGADVFEIDIGQLQTWVERGTSRS